MVGSTAGELGAQVCLTDGNADLIAAIKTTKNVTVQVLNWCGDDVYKGPPVDVVIGSDIFYDPSCQGK